MRISIGSDHAGFEQKWSLISYLSDAGHQVIDRGPENGERVDYPDYAETVAHDVAQHRADFGVLICGTGIGMAMAANKVAGVRAANITSVEFAILAREHNDANVVTLSGRFVSPEDNERILDAFLNTSFAGGHHADRVGKITALENGCDNAEGVDKTE